MNNKKTLLLGLCVLLLFILGYFPVLRFLGKKWIDSFDYTYAFFAVPVIIYMIWQKWRSFEEGKGANLLGLAGVVLTTGLYIACLHLKIFTISSVLMVLTVVCAFVYLGGWRIVRVLVIPILLMFLLIPIPNQLYVWMTLPLQLKVSQVSELLIHLFHVPLFREGNVLTTPGKVFEVIEACSGIRSLMALFSLSLMLGYFTLRRNLSVLLLLAFGVPVAMFVNIVRVVLMILAYHYFALDLTEGSAHTITSSVVFTVALALLYMLQRILESWETKKIPN
jgi:exosortase